MPEAGTSGSVQLLEADPDLGRGLDPRRIREVSQRPVRASDRRTSRSVGSRAHVSATAASRSG